VIRRGSLPLSEAQIKSYMLMLLRGVDYCHTHHIMHRVRHISSTLLTQQDLKPANLLLNSSGTLKIADFGLARVFSDEESGSHYSHQVATR
jgi:cell cycle related kinase